LEKVKLEGTLSLVVGDELYFGMERKDLIFVGEYKDVDIEVVFDVIEDEVPIAKIYIMPKGQETIYKETEEGISCPANRDVDSKELGCDTASYMFNGIGVNTLADGYYGMAVYERKGKHALVKVDGGYMGESYEDFKEKILFGLKEGLK